MAEPTRRAVAARAVEEVLAYLSRRHARGWLSSRASSGDRASTPRVMPPPSKRVPRGSSGPRVFRRIKRERTHREIFGDLGTPRKVKTGLDSVARVSRGSPPTVRDARDDGRRWAVVDASRARRRVHAVDVGRGDTPRGRGHALRVLARRRRDIDGAGGRPLLCVGRRGDSSSREEASRVRAEHRRLERRLSHAPEGRLEGGRGPRQARHGRHRTAGGLQEAHEARRGGRERRVARRRGGGRPGRTTAGRGRWEPSAAAAGAAGAGAGAGAEAPAEDPASKTAREAREARDKAIARTIFRAFKDEGPSDSPDVNPLVRRRREREDAAERGDGDGVKRRRPRGVVAQAGMSANNPLRGMF